MRRIWTCSCLVLAIFFGFLRPQLGVAAVFVVNSSGDDADSFSGDGICDTRNRPWTVPPTPPSGICTLRAAIQQATLSVGPHTIRFEVVEVTVTTFFFPSIGSDVTIDGRGVQLALPFGVRISISGDNSAVSGLIVNASNGGGISVGGTGNTVSGVIVNGSPTSGISVGGTGNVVERSFIGIDVTGSRVVSGGGAFLSLGGNANVIRHNVIPRGLSILGSGHVVEGNFIGTDASGSPLSIAGNQPTCGVIMNTGTRLNTIRSNVIAGCGVGVFLFNSNENLIEGNLIEVDAAGSIALASHIGVSVVGSRNTVTGNVVSGNEIGINIGDPSTDNLIQGNFIGTNAQGAPLGNRVGIKVRGSNNLLGGTETNEGNVIAFNRQGVLIEAGTGNAILSNRMFGNGDPGIDLRSPLEPTSNDPMDSDSGPNALQNSPVLSSIVQNSSVVGILESTPNTSFRLQFFTNVDCHPSGFGEGRALVGSIVVTTDSAGHADFVGALTGVQPTDRFLTATATDPRNNSSEFSRCLPLEGKVVVITHGWTRPPERFEDGPPSWVTGMQASIVGSAAARGIEVHVHVHHWPGAYTDNAQRSHGSVRDAGVELGSRLLEALGPGYSGSLHFIGHSHGALVNAYAAGYLSGLSTGQPVVQFTILDMAGGHIPFLPIPSTDLGIFECQLRRPFVTWVDNYYGELFLGAFGRDLPGSYSVKLRGLNHSEVHEWYQRSITESRQEGFYWSEVGGGFESRPAPRSWGPVCVSAPPGLAVRDFVTGFYLLVLHREPAGAEVAQWENFLSENPTSGSVSSMAHAFLDGAEYLDRAETLSTYVTLLYQLFLARTPDAPELAGWVSRLQSDFDTALPGFVNSSEFRTLVPDVHNRAGVDAVIERLYRQVLGRTPAASEVAAWTDYTVATGDLLGVAKGFFGSAEYNGTVRTLAQHVAILYRTFLGRDPAAAEIPPWVNFLEASRAAVEDSFIASPEFQGHFLSLFE